MIIITIVVVVTTIVMNILILILIMKIIQSIQFESIWAALGMTDSANPESADRSKAMGLTFCRGLNNWNRDLGSFVMV